MHEFVETKPRERTLHTAAALISGDRARAYGDVGENFTRIGALSAPILGVQNITPAQVALCLTQLKVARLVANPTHVDSWVGAAGYIALGSEVAGA